MVEIPGRCNGPDGSGNGGFSCGTFVAPLPEGTFTVRLRRPPPLDTSMTISRTAEGWAVSVADAVIAEVRRGTTTVTVDAPPSLEAATRAARRYPGLERHAFPRCVVCGTERDDGLGLRPGPLDHDPRFAAPWVPGLQLGSGGRLDSPWVWAALDCPSGWATDQRLHRVAVLGTMTAQLLAPVEAGKAHIVTGWHLGSHGRKHRAASAIHSTQGQLCAVAESVWLVVE